MCKGIIPATDFLFLSIGARNMSKKRRSIIKAGTCVEVIEYIPPNRHDTPKARAAKSKASSEARKARNKALSKKNLKMKLAANFMPGRDYWCGLDFDPEHEPRTRAECKAAFDKFRRRMYDKRKLRGQSFKWVCVLERKHAGGRWHIHLVIDASSSWQVDLEEMISLWENGGVTLECLFTGKHRNSSWAKLARYMSKERPEEDVEQNKPWAQSYHCSRNLVGAAVVFDGFVDSSSCYDLPSTVLENTANMERVETLFSVYFYCSYELPHEAA